MGLTLHYELRAPAAWPASKIDAVLAALREASLTKGFAEVSPLVLSEAGDDGTRWAAALEFFAGIIATPFGEDEPPFEGDPSTARAYFVDPGEQCETASFGFLQRRDANQEVAGWFWYCSCKTQYASIVSDDHFIACHTNLVALLDLARTLGVEVVVHDEGQYWETRDTSRLLAELKKMNHLIARFAGKLTDADHQVQAPIFEHRRFERLEMGEDE